MAIGIILGIVIALLCIGVFILGGRFLYDNYDQPNKEVKIKGLVSIVAGVALLFCFILIPFSFRTVDTGEVAVVKKLGDAKSTRTSGTYFDFWVTKKYERYDTKVQNVDITTAAYSSDAQTMDVAMTIQYQIDASKAIEIAKQYGNLTTLTSRIQNVAIEKTKSVLSSKKALDIIKDRASISPSVEQAIKDAVGDEYHVFITTVVLTNIDFSDAFEKSVEDTMIAEQEVKKAEYEKQIAIKNAEKELEVARKAAEAKIVAAQADAKAQEVVAKAEANAIKLKSVEVARALGFKIIETEVEVESKDDNGNVIVETVIEYEISFEGKSADEIKVITDYMQYIEYLAKWNGELPDVVSDGSVTVMVPTP